MHNKSTEDEKKKKLRPIITTDDIKWLWVILEISSPNDIVFPILQTKESVTLHLQWQPWIWKLA